jgi:propionate catabolism operon transcriptional regulator
MSPDASPLAQRKPRVIAVGVHRLRSLFNELAPAYADRAALSVLDCGFEAAVHEIRDLARQQRVDALVAAGSNGEYLRQRLDIPVILVRVGGFDIMRALGRARDLSARIALVTYGTTPPDVSHFNQLFQLGIEQRCYRTDQDANDCVRELRARGIEVIVAPGLVTDLAVREGMRGVFLYSMDAVRQALDDAVDGVCQGAPTKRPQRVSLEGAHRALRARRLRPWAVRHELSDLIGDSAAIRHARQLASRYARSEGTVLIMGESGTGKELLAQGIHQASRRSAHPFIAVNCAAFTETLLESELFGYEDGAFTGARRGGKAGLFEAARSGTIFLDEIGEMPPAMQTRLLRVLQQREVLRIGAVEPTSIDVRVIAATHRDLLRCIDEQVFRRDLYYRLNVLRVELPSLRERRQDLPLLMQHVVGRVCARLGANQGVVAAYAEQLLAAAADYDWPGNVRELENLIERIASVAAHAADRSELSLSELIPEIYQSRGAPRVALSLMQRKRQTEGDLVRRVLAECEGDRDAACKRLGIGRTTLWRKLRMSE